LKHESDIGFVSQNAQLHGSRVKLGWKSTLFVMLAALKGEAEEGISEPTLDTSDWVHSLLIQLEEGLKSYRLEPHSVGQAEFDWFQSVIAELQRLLSCSSASESSPSFLTPAVRMQLLNLFAQHCSGPEKNHVSTPTTSRSTLSPSSIGIPISSPHFSHSSRLRVTGLKSKTIVKSSSQNLDQVNFVDSARLGKCILAQVGEEDALSCQAISRHCAVTSENDSIFTILARACRCTVAEVSICIPIVDFLPIF